ncbi:MAG TPA: hypothetical protein VFB96_15530 [Pirellulaceae bacterium]|nr:hypothetical protein [Pirellulaceae bacterium]
MRFDSQPVPGDEAYPARDGQLELPDDLALMGEQLRDDAQRLASSYPAHAGPVVEVVAALQSAASPRRARRDLLVSGAVGGLVALVLLVMFTVGLGNFVQRGDRQTAPPQTADNHRATNAADKTTTLAAAPREEPDAKSIVALPGELLTPASFTGAVPAVTPAVLTSGITGPEMEAWMDLRQDELETDRDSLEF